LAPDKARSPFGLALLAIAAGLLVQLDFSEIALPRWLEVYGKHDKTRRP